MDTRTTPAPNRIIPHNVEAEQAVLGALLLDPEAIVQIIPLIRTEDFYLEKHQWIFQAIYALHERREPIDFLTVVAELERRGHLSEVGGAAYITALINAVPSAIHIEHYARLVERLATQRRLISAAGRIAEIAYAGDEDIDAILDRAEEAVFAVAQRRLSRDVISMRVAVDQFMDHLDYVQRHQGELLGVPTGFIDLDKLLGGLQPSDLIIIAGRPGSGKTSFALSLMQTAAARYKKHIALFSLEMSAEQLVQRLVASLGQIDATALRQGKLSDEDYARLVRATGELSELPIFIDDSAALTPIEIRAKARRLHAEHGLDLIIIDYLQLMTVRGRVENRVQEISQISRQLKELARELKVPVVALSQLSRAVESRQDHRPQLADLRESGCLTGDTLVTRADTGERIRLDALVAYGKPIPVLAMDENLRLRSATLTRAFPSGRKRVFELQTRTGRRIRASANHPFYRLSGWTPLSDLHIGDRIAGAPDEQAALATSDIFWDEIVSITDQGEEEVFDATVPEFHNFVANDFIVHNSIEQDADVVIFIYREKMYYPTIEKWREAHPRTDREYPGNIAEVIVAKHRHGPTRDLKLYFAEEQATFKNLEAAPQ